ncbi:MAG: hypothetical protein GQ570_09665 [Helicobacteraceae bacterium]|nr:hypothetical protein [Helicobacteraceae bacterium]
MSNLLDRLNEELMFEIAVKESDVIEKIEEWDSLAYLSVLNVFDEVGVDIEIEELEKCKSIREILEKASS